MRRPKDALPKRLLPVKSHPDMFAFLVEFDQAEWGEGIPGRRDYSTVEQLRALVPANGTRVWTDFTREKLWRAVEGGRFMIVDFWLGSSQTVGHAKRDGENYQAYLDARMEWLRELQRKWGNRVWFCICGEMDNALIWPKTMFASKKQAYDYFRDAHLTNISGRYDPYPSAQRTADFPMMRDRYHVDFQKEPVAMLIGMCIGAH